MIPNWAMRLPMNLVYQKANEANLDPCILAAICWQESNGFVYAVRYEPSYRWLYKVDDYAAKLKITRQTEEQLQKQSYGLCQIMGATARSIGFEGPLPALYKPENNLYWGCKFLSQLFQKYGNYEDAVSSYNAGSVRKTDGGFYENQKYVDSVFKLYRELTSIA